MKQITSADYPFLLMASVIALGVLAIFVSGYMDTQTHNNLKAEVERYYGTNCTAYGIAHNSDMFSCTSDNILIYCATFNSTNTNCWIVDQRAAQKPQIQQSERGASNSV